MVEKKSAAKKTPAKRKAAERTPRAPEVEDVEAHDESDDAPVGEQRTAYIALCSGRAQAVQYEVIHGDAVVEADIVLGTVEQVERDSEILKAEMRGELASAVVISGDQFRWPDCKVPYTIDSSLTNQARVTDAIQHWEDNTNFEFVLRTSSNASQHPDYVTFRPSTGCSSMVGRRGGQQFINLAPGCTLGNTIHEIGHAVGLWHEQSREDRDAFVTIHWQNIIDGREHNFNQHISDGDDVGAYDYGSIMHYPRTAFTKNGQDTITPTNPPSAAIGQRVGLSPGDIAAADAMCPGSKPRIETIKELSPETIKERFPETAKELSPETIKERFPETAKELSPETIKERFPETAKELSPETIKERFPETAKELSPETIKERFPEAPVTRAEAIGPNLGGRITNPVVTGGRGGARPFAVRTPHLGAPVGRHGDAAADEHATLAADAEALALAYTEGDASLQEIGAAYEATIARLAELEGM